MTTDNKELVRKLYSEAWERGNLDFIYELYAEGVEIHMQGVPEDPFGPAPMVQLVSMARTAAPGLRVTIDDLISEYDKVVALITIHGGFQGQVSGAKPRENVSVWRRIDVYRFHNGLVVEQWSDRNDITLLRDIGVGVPHVDQGLALE